jgi:hypothetical protein
LNGWKVFDFPLENSGLDIEYLATDGIRTNDLFGSPMIQQPGESGNATDTQGDAPETLSIEDLY